MLKNLHYFISNIKLSISYLTKYTFNCRILQNIFIITRIYKLQDSGVSFKTAEEFITKLGSKFAKTSQQSLRELLVNEQFNSNIIDEITNIACLTNYGQSNAINSFCGLISLAGGFSGKLWSIKEANKSVPIKLLEKSGALIKLNTKVRRISPDTNQPNTKNTLTYETNDDGLVTESFDYVLIAFPIYNDVLTSDNFTLDFDSASQFKALEMQQTNTYFVYGHLKMFPTLPACKGIELFSVDPYMPCRSIATQQPCDFSPKVDKDKFVKNSSKLYKIFSDKNLVDIKEFEKIFDSDYSIVKFLPWLAYPKYESKIDFKRAPKIVLDNEDRSRVFYLNALEWCSSCMEMACISARNASILILDKEKSEVVVKKKIFFRNERNYENILHKICGFFTLILCVNFIFGMFYKSS